MSSRAPFPCSIHPSTLTAAIFRLCPLLKGSPALSKVWPPQEGHLQLVILSCSLSTPVLLPALSLRLPSYLCCQAQPASRTMLPLGGSRQPFPYFGVIMVLVHLGEPEKAAGLELTSAGVCQGPPLWRSQSAFVTCVRSNTSGVVRRAENQQRKRHFCA